jgi:hypothetical protein
MSDAFRLHFASDREWREAMALADQLEAKGLPRRAWRVRWNLDGPPLTTAPPVLTPLIQRLVTGRLDAHRAADGRGGGLAQARQVGTARRAGQISTARWRRCWTSARRAMETSDLVLTLLDSGMTAADIGRRCGVLPSKVSRWRDGGLRARSPALDRLRQAVEEINGTD